MLETDDLFLGAFGLVRGGELSAVLVRGTNGRRVAVFQIAGSGMDDAEREYHRGAALVDLRLLKSQVRRLKDAAFEVKRCNGSWKAPDAADSGDEEAGIGARGTPSASCLAKSRPSRSSLGRASRSPARA